MIKNDKIKQMYNYFYVIMLLLIDFGWYSVNNMSGFSRILIMIILTIILFVLNFRLTFYKKTLLLMMISFFYILIYSLLDSSYKSSLILLIAISIAFIATSIIKRKEMLNIFINLMVFFSIYSLIFFIIGYIDMDSLSFFPTSESLITHMKNKNFIFSYINLSNPYYMNAGFAWEQGAFSLLLSFAMLLNFINDSKHKFFNTCVLTITNISTFSTLGFGLMAILFLIFFVDFVKENNDKKYFIYPIIIISIIIVLIKAPLIYDMSFKKLEGLFDSSKEMNNSLSARINSIIYPFKAFLTSPIFGIGFSKFDVLNHVYCGGVATNTITNLLSLYGVTLGIPYIYFYFKSLFLNNRISKLGFIKKSLLIVFLLLLVATESVLTISFIYIIAFYGTMPSEVRGNAHE